MTAQAELFAPATRGELPIRPVFSECDRYRYFLPRVWNTELPVWLFIGANPSIAGRVVNGRQLSDNTISGQVNRARALGFGGVWAVNCRSWVSTDPAGVPPDPEGIGPETDAWIVRAVALADLVVCAWGLLAGDRGPHVLELVRSAGHVPHALGLTASGAPRHPRGVPSSARPFPMGGFRG